MTELSEITVSELRASDVGARIILTQEGVAFDGTLANLNTTRSDYQFKDRPRVTASVTAKILDAADSGIGGDKVRAEVKIDNLPLDYLIQIERDEETE